MTPEEYLLFSVGGIVGCIVGCIVGGYASWQDAQAYFLKHPEELGKKKW